MNTIFPKISDGAVRFFLGEGVKGSLLSGLELKYHSINLDSTIYYKAALFFGNDLTKDFKKQLSPRSGSNLTCCLEELFLVFSFVLPFIGNASCMTVGDRF
jgi:hypothetical protein